MMMIIIIIINNNSDGDYNNNNISWTNHASDQQPVIQSISSVGDLTMKCH